MVPPFHPSNPPSERLILFLGLPAAATSSTTAIFPGNARSNDQEEELMISAADWKSKTSRDWHYRSGDLEAVDTALASYHTNPSPANFQTLQDAFANWYRKNPKEANKRNKDNCVQQLRKDLDRQQVGNHAYIGFKSIANGEARRDRAIFGMNKLRELATQCQARLAQVVAQSATSAPAATWNAEKRNATELFQKWFDATRKQSSLNEVARIFNNIVDSLSSKAFEVVVYGTPEDPDPEGQGQDIVGAFAYVVPSENAYRIYLAQHFFSEMAARVDVPTASHGISAPNQDQWRADKKSKTAIDASLITMMHELTHVPMIGDTDDVDPDPYGLPECLNKARNSPHLAIKNAENYAQFASKIHMSQRFFSATSV
jgi:hypothetical protein